MGTQVDEFADRLGALDDRAAVWTATAELAYDLGFTSCTLTLAHATDLGLEPFHLASDLDPSFRRAYIDNGLIEQDPFLHFSCSSLSAKFLGTKDLTSYPDADSRHQVFLDYVSDAGAGNALAVPVRTRDQPVFGGWLFASGDQSESFATLVEDHSTEMHLAGVLAYERMVQLDDEGSGQPKILSPRERDCLLYLSTGQQPARISKILGISESAVNLYTSNAKRKLGAETREQAIVVAIISGEIEL